MRKKYKLNGFLSLLFFLCYSVLFAQEITISGKVTDNIGEPMPGVNILVKGTTNGVTTSIDGTYSISVNEDAILVFSFIGYLAQEINVGNRTSINVTMEEDVQTLGEVVVTALGIERSSKALQSSVTTVGGDNFTQARENSTANALAGRVAGVNVTKVSSGPAGSSRVVIRGAKTLGSTLNQPLYVVDGVPMTNNNYGQAGVWGGSDQGDGLNSINPDDIASITVLKGASAAALYGSRAANGVIIVTTKKGTKKDNLGVEFNSNIVFEKVNNLSDLQTTHGSGGMVGATMQTRVATKAESLTDLSTAWNNGWYSSAWGPRFDGSSVVHFDGITRKYENTGDNWSRYYQTGTAWTNSLALTGGSETQSFRISFADLKSSGVIPNSGFDRLNTSISTNSKFGDKITVTTSTLYSQEDAKNRPNVSDSPGNGVQAVWRLPGDVNVDYLYGDPNKPGAVPSLDDQVADGIIIQDGKVPGEEYQIHSNLWGQNPWWTAYQFKNSDKRDRIITTGQIRFDITDFLYLQGRAGMDWSTRRGTNVTPEGTGYQRGGSMSESEARVREVNMEYLIGFDKSFSQFNVNAFFGGNRMRNSWEQISANGSGFNVPFFEAINNARDRNFGYGFAESGINSVFGSAEVSYNNYLFLTSTWRRDYFSVLNPENNSIDYPSLGLSFVFSDILTELPDWLSFGKFRTAWGQVGNVASVGAYETLSTYNLGNAHLGRPMAFISGAENNDGTLRNPDLVPFTSTETEVGFDIRLFNNRLGLDIAYYSQKTTNDILDAGISKASGFGYTSVNVGEISNKGIEFLLTGKPLEGDLRWNVSLNFAKNNNTVKSLIEGQDQLFVEEPRTRTAAVFHVVGSPYGMILGLTQTRTSDGLLVYDADGAPVTDNTYKVLGNGVPDFTGGINNEFSYGDFNASFLIDFKSGGDIYSGTNVRLTGAGFHKQTLAGREGESELTVTGAIQNGIDGNGDPIYEPFTKTLTPGEAQNYWGQLSNRAQENFIYDASFIKLRQVTLGYAIPTSFLETFKVKSLNVSFVARNLAILNKNIDNVDPESGYSSSNAQGLDYFGMPATRTYGFNLRATF